MVNKSKKLFKGTPLYLSKSGKLQGFTYLMMNLPFICNFRCKKCFNLKNNNSFVPHKTLSLDIIFKLISEAKEMGAKAVILAGEGEPTLNKNIKKIIEKINSLGLLSIVYSNGSLLTKKIIGFYSSHNTMLVISFDSLSSDLYLKLTGNKNQKIFFRVLKNIKLAREIYKKYIEFNGEYKVVRLAINTTVNSLNENEIVKIKQFCGDDIYFICNPLAKLGNATENWRELINSDKDLKEITKLVKRMSETTGPLTLGSNGICGYSINGIAVNPCGDYMTCAYTSLTNGLLGSVTDKSLKEAYNYKNNQEINYYNIYGKYPCLVRSPKFNQYIKTLKNNKNA